MEPSGFEQADAQIVGTGQRLRSSTKTGYRARFTVSESSNVFTSTSTLMQIIHSIRALQDWRRHHQLKRGTIGFVPTLGALHEGHRSLLQQARKTNDSVVASIFVNPLQFGPSEDFHSYPRTLAADQAMCDQEGVDLLFIPKRNELYPTDFQTSVSVSLLTARWEGESRPQHFPGVTTIVTKLLILLQPDHAFFGQKDYQQFLVIKQLVKDLNLAMRIVGCPTIREADGLAFSSRNRYLTTGQRSEAARLYQTLRHGGQLIRQGQRQGRVIKKAIFTRLTRTTSGTIDYIGICNSRTLEPLATITGQVTLLGAIRFGKVRLIDNLRVRVPRGSDP